MSAHRMHIFFLYVFVYYFAKHLIFVNVCIVHGRCAHQIFIPHVQIQIGITGQDKSKERCVDKVLLVCEFEKMMGKEGV